MKNKTISACAVGVPGTGLVTLSLGVASQVCRLHWLDNPCATCIGHGFLGTYVLDQGDLLSALAARFGIENISVVSKNVVSVVYSVMVDDATYSAFGFDDADSDSVDVPFND